ncbi:hypothetical protein O3G_MSEX011940 [Manduca sexta]|uniref:Uncharacterized protein n=1 Tax=Manduca sexta TaxID=7130 RepID=A0A922CVZ0_MANSE|nr:hypothetical protein O3G_MSEX011940 [Manduca sexta]
MTVLCAGASRRRAAHPNESSPARVYNARSHHVQHKLDSSKPHSTLWIKGNYTVYKKSYEKKSRNMKYLVILSFALLEVYGFPYNPYYGNVDSLSYGSSDSARGGMVMSRYYNPYYQRAAGGGMAAFMYKQPEPQAAPSSQYYLPDRRRQTLDDTNYVPPQQNELFTTVVPVVPVKEVAPVVPELSEPEPLEEEPAPKAKKVVNKKKQVKRPVEDEEDEDESYPPHRMPSGAFFPMFFGWGGRSGGGPGGPTAIANAYSTGRGGVATSHATAYGGPRPEEKL